MKKILFSVLSSFLVFGVVAQSETETLFKQYSGARSVEVQFAPFGGAPVSIGGLRFRSFTSENSAWRINGFIGISSNRDNTEEVDGNGDEVILKDVTSSFTIDLRPGIEFHFAGTNRLSPYYGGEGIIGFRSSTQKTEDLDADNTTVIMNKRKNSGNDGYFRLGANAILGADFYVAKSVYLGTEIGFGLRFDLEHDDVLIPENGDESTIAFGGTNFTLGPNVQAQIRLGFLF